MTVDPLAALTPWAKTRTSAPSLKFGEKLRSLADVLAQSSRLSDLPFTAISYWYCLGFPDGTCMSADQIFSTKPPFDVGSESRRYRK